LQLRIKSIQNVDILVAANAVVSDVKDQVRNALGPQSQNRYLRLICKGRLLAPDTCALSEFSVENLDVLHAVLGPAGADPANNNATATIAIMPNSSPSRRRRRRRGGTVVGPGGRVTRVTNGNGDEDSSTSNDEDEEQGRERRGFDRLRSSGLSRQEITAIRTYFSRHVDRHVQQHPSSHADITDLRSRRFLMEEDWMALQGPTSEFRLNLNQNTLLRFAAQGGLGGTNANGEPTHWRASLGTDRDFMWGFLLGFFVGFVMLVWVWMPTVPHKQKIGILTGISFQLAMNVLQQDQEDEFVEAD
jgi:hypothetical protein